MDGIFRLIGGVIAYYLISQTEYATSLGIVVAGVLFFFVTKSVMNKHFDINQRTDFQSAQENTTRKIEFASYLRSSFVIFLLHATVVHLDKWLLDSLIDRGSVGVYAILYFLAMTVMSIASFFFETLAFPILFSEKNKSKLESYLKVLFWSYLLTVSLLVSVVYLWGDWFLLLLTNPQIASHSDVFTLLVLGCALLNFGKLQMVEGLIDKEPNRYWPSYVVLLTVFVIWCLLLVTPETGLKTASQGLIIGTLIFLATIKFLNVRKNRLNE
jgi:hypothetical protein